MKKKILSLLLSLLVLITLAACGNVSYRIYEGGTHGPEASNQYTFNALLWFWND